MADTRLSSSTLLSMYEKMVRIRAFEEKALELVRLSEIGSIHAYMGQEAIVAGISEHVRIEDFFVSNHRAIGHYLAKGGDMNKLMAELVGKATGCSGGKGGEMHLCDTRVGFLGSFPIIGAAISIATGAAFACKQIRKDDRIVLCFFGEGAANNGCFHEALNIASVYALPILYVCENNGMTINLQSREVSATERTADRASAYLIESAVVDGHDPVAVYKAAEHAIRIVRASKPFLLEAFTTRLRPHKEHLPDPRDRSKLRDALLEFEGYLMREEVLEPGNSEAMKNEVRLDVESAVTYALDSPWPDASIALSDN